MHSPSATGPNHPVPELRTCHEQPDGDRGRGRGVIAGEREVLRAGDQQMSSGQGGGGPGSVDGRPDQLDRKSAEKRRHTRPHHSSDGHGRGVRRSSVPPCDKEQYGKQADSPGRIGGGDGVQPRRPISETID